MQYKIISAYGPTDLEIRVNDFLMSTNQDWEAVGGVVYAPDGVEGPYVQTLIKKDLEY